MAITSVAGVLSGLQPPVAFNKAIGSSATVGKPFSLWSQGGYPVAGGFNTTLAGAIYSSSAGVPPGAIPHYDPPVGNSYLARLETFVTNGGQMMLCDRLWDNGGITITSTTAQTVNSVTWPARDNAGTTNGAGVYLGVEVSATVGAGTPTLTLNYTNSGGIVNRNGVNIDATAGSAVTGNFYRIGVIANDAGVQSVQSITLSATWTSGTINIVAYRVLAQWEQSTFSTTAIDALTGGFPQLFNGTCPFFIIIPSTAQAQTVAGIYVESQG